MKSKRKFSLGEILRKVNEEQAEAAAKAPDAPDAASRAAPENPAGSERPAGTVPVDTLAPEPPVQGTELPAETGQPRPLPEETGPVQIHLPRQKKGPGAEPAETRPPRMPVSDHPAPGTTPGRTGDDEEEVEFDLFRYIGIILRRKNIVLAIALLMTLFSVFQFLKGDKFYTANARLLYKPEEKQIIGDQTYRYSGEREKAFNTHLELLRSNTVLNMVSDNLGNAVLANGIRRSLTIAQGQTNKEKNDIIELSYKNASPALARDVLNELCKTYIDYRLEVNSQEITRLLYKLEVPIKKMQDELDAKESNLRRFKEENRMVALTDETSVTVKKLTDMEIELQKTQLDLVDSKERLASLTSQIPKQELNTVQSVTFTDPIKDKLAQLELEYNTLSAENSPEHFKVKMIRQQIDRLKSAAVDSLTAEAASRTLVKNPIRQSLVQDLVNLNIERSALEAKRIALEQVIERLNADLLKLPSMEQKYAFLQRETESILQTLRLLKTKYEETKIRRESQETDIKILELADLPRSAVSSKKPSSVIIGILIGLILGIALAFLLEYLDQSVKDPTDVEKGLGLPLLGLVPLIETRSALIQKSSDLTKTILEPFRTLRANLKHLAATYNYQTFMICSAVKGEGKTTLAANLAITFALDGKKTVLIDADLRRSQVHNLFSIPKETGLTDFLLGTKSVDQIIKKTVYENLFLITSGERPHNPAELVGTYRFDTLVKELRQRADFVIFDSPALLPVSDTLTMAPKMDACIVILRTMWTPLKAAKQAVYQLKRMGCHILGGIFNGVTSSRAYYPYYYGYYGYYSYNKYTYDDEQRKKFSLRELGLKIETSVKTGAKNLRYGMPKYLAKSGSFSRQLARKKSFWLLLLLFLGLTGVELWLTTRPQPATQDEEGIRYLGVGGGGQENVDVRSVNSEVEEIQQDAGKQETGDRRQGTERQEPQSPGATGIQETGDRGQETAGRERQSIGTAEGQNKRAAEIQGSERNQNSRPRSADSMRKTHSAMPLRTEKPAIAKIPDIGKKRDSVVRGIGDSVTRDIGDSVVR